VTVRRVVVSVALARGVLPRGLSSDTKLAKNEKKMKNFVPKKYSDKNVVGYMFSADSQIPKYRGHDL